ncbi:MAG: hypothetical protein A2X47_00580 [Lentisphaerae bacterium GWF2_38_69]|nr:MAG: hypothetical protein A2X47_00580 [Lentisphaerae bacterium GWF2_38_69]
MLIKKLRIEEIPALLYAKESVLRGKTKGAVIMYHGSSASKEIHEKELKSIAEAGLLAIGIDCVWHGERLNPDLENLFNHNNPDMFKNMLKAVNATALELPVLTDFLNKNLGVQNRRIGILGISMGAFIVYKALSIYPKIKCSAAILGTPKYCLYESGNYLKSFSKHNLLSVNAGKDQYISNKETRHLHSILKKRYESYADRFLYKEYKLSDHFMLPDDWNDCWHCSLDFLKKNLS